MNIAFDIDNTLLTYNESLLAYGQKFELEKFGKLSKIKSIDADSSEAMFNWKDDVSLEFWHKYLDEVLFIPPRFLVVETLKKLKSEGHKIYILTSREPKYFNDAYNFSKKWLKKFKISYDELFVNVQNKAQKCLELNIDAFFDDDPKFCVPASLVGIKTYMFHSFRNYDFNDKKIKKVYSFIEIKNEINKLASKQLNLKKK